MNSEENGAEAHKKLKSKAGSEVPPWIQHPEAKPRFGWEKDEETLARRLKDIDKGKASDVYKAYVRDVPKHSRIKDVHPRTPNRYLKCSRRSWDMQVRVWRKMLHYYEKPLRQEKKPSDDASDVVDMDGAPEKRTATADCDAVTEDDELPLAMDPPLAAVENGTFTFQRPCPYSRVQSLCSEAGVSFNGDDLLNQSSCSSSTDLHNWSYASTNDLDMSGMSDVEAREDFDRNWKPPNMWR